MEKKRAGGDMDGLGIGNGEQGEMGPGTEKG
jgi:hypothetical protein